ncbi:hypothetical protein D3C76_1004720 [compost metagenome]
MVKGGEHQVCQAFLGTDGDDGFAFRVDIDLVAVLVPARDSPAQTRNATGGGIAVGVIALGDLYQLLDDMRRRGAVGVTHAQVDDVLATTTGGHLQLGSDIEDIRGETIDARKAARRTLFGHDFLGYVSARNRPSDAGHCGGREGEDRACTGALSSRLSCFIRCFWDFDLDIAVFSGYELE